LRGNWFKMVLSPEVRKSESPKDGAFVKFRLSRVARRGDKNSMRLKVRKKKETFDFKLKTLDLIWGIPAVGRNGGRVLCSYACRPYALFHNLTSQRLSAVIALAKAAGIRDAP